MAHAFTFKRFEAGKPISIQPASVKANPTSWEFVEVGQSMENEPAVLRVLNTAELHASKKAITPEQYQEVLASVEAGVEMLKELTELRSTLISRGYQVTGQTQLSFSNGWLNCRLYRIVKLNADQSNQATLATL
jgi:hypothetical protein